MKHTQEEILESLQVIKETCEEIGSYKDGCYKCPFARNGLCILLDEEPYTWEINHGESVWKAFK